MSQVLQITDYKGYYLTVSDLTTNIPVGAQGWWAIIDANNSIYIWNVSAEAWEINSGFNGKVNTYADLPTPPSDYYGQIWAVLTRSGSNLAGLYSSDGINWNIFSAFNFMSLSGVSPINYNNITGVISLAYDTTNLILSAGNLTIIQPINASATPTWAGLTLTGFSGIIKASGGVFAGSATTSDLPEGSNLYFTNAKSIASILTGYSVGSNTPIAATDSILAAFEKTQAQINAITGGYVTSISGTTNQINVSASTGAITLSTPQNIDTAANVTFGTQILNAGQNIGSTINASSTNQSNYPSIIVGATSQTNVFTAYQNDLGNIAYFGVNPSGHATNPNDAFISSPKGIRAIVANGEAVYIDNVGNVKVDNLTGSQLVVTNSNKQLASANLSGDVTTVGTVSHIVATSNSTLTTLSVLALPYSQLTGTVPTWNQNTTGSAATLTTPRAINGVNFDGSAAITITAAAGTLTGSTLNSTVTISSLTALGMQSQTLNMGSNYITSLLDPVNAQDAATKNYVDTSVLGLLNYRGSYNASTNLFPSTGGSGVLGAIRKGDFWICSVAGTLGSTAVTPGDLIISIVNTPGQTAANWDLIAHDLGSYVTSVSGTANRIISSGGSTPTIDIASTYIGQSSITTLGTISSGSIPFSLVTGTVPVNQGGTNIASYTIGDIIYASGSTTLSKLADVATGSVLVSGGVGVAPSYSNSPTVTNLTATSTIIANTIGITGTASIGTAQILNTGLKVQDTSGNYYMSIIPGSSYTANRALTITTGDSARTITLSGNLTVSSAATISGTNTGDQTITLTGNVTGSGTGSFATTIANNAVVNSMIANSTIDLTAKVTGILPNANTTATSTNTASAIVTRDLSGNFTAGTITSSGFVANDLQYQFNNTAASNNSSFSFYGNGSQLLNTQITFTTPATSCNLVGDTTSQTLTNKTLTSPTINGGSSTALTSFSLRDTSAAFNVILAATSSVTLTANRTLTLDLANAARTISLSGNLTLANNLITSGNFSLTLNTTGTTNITFPTSGTLVNNTVNTLSSLASIGTITTGVWQGTAVGVGYGGTGGSSFTPYSVICGGTTSNGALQNVSGVGTSGQVLTSNGASALPTWKNAGMYLLASNVLASNAASVTFSSFSSSFNHLRIVAIFRSAASGAQDTMSIQFNGDNASDYNTETLRGNNATASAFVNNSIDYAYIGDCPGAGATSNFCASAVVDIPVYNGTTFYKIFSSVTTSLDTAASRCFSQIWSGSWSSTNAITSIKLYFPGGANIVAGSSFYLYGIN